jgi:hypothetical protein
MTEPLILKNRVFIQDRASKILIAGSLVLLFLVVPLTLLMILDIPLNAETLSKAIDGLQKHIIDAFTEEPVESSFDALIYISFPIFLVYMYLSDRNERLILTSVGIRYVSALPEPFDFLCPGWFIRWDQITNVRLERARFLPAPALSPLTLTTRTYERRLRLHFWVNPGTWKRVTKRRFGIPVQPSPVEILEDLVSGELVEYIRTHVPDMEINIDIEGEVSKQHFRLEDHPWSYGQSMALLALLGYALLDTFIFKTEVFAGEPPIAIYAAAGVLIGGLSALQLFRVQHRCSAASCLTSQRRRIRFGVDCCCSPTAWDSVSLPCSLEPHRPRLSRGSPMRKPANGPTTLPERCSLASGFTFALSGQEPPIDSIGPL